MGGGRKERRSFELRSDEYCRGTAGDGSLDFGPHTRFTSAFDLTDLTFITAFNQERPSWIEASALT